MPNVAFRSASADGYTSGTSISVSRPAGTTNGDGLIAYIYTQTGGALPTYAPASGWTSVRRVTTASGVLEVFKKVASGEPASWTFTASDASDFNRGCLAYSGAHSDFVEANVGAATGQTGTTQTATAVTTLTANAIVLAILGEVTNAINGSANPPSGMTERVDSAPSITFHVTAADVVQASAGSSGTKSFTVTNNPIADAITITLSLKGTSTTHAAAAALSATATLSPVAGLLFTPGAALAAAATLSPLATGEVLAAAALSGTGTLTADGNLGVIFAASALVGSATLAALAAPLVKTAAAALSASALLTASATRIAPIKTVSLGAGFTSSLRQHGGVAY